ncbi:MAG: Fur family transcriptional regulator [Acidaminococcaceae bacterium]|nr:Fur family transcriptional regulator [Acidaminococcaceae bacterium]
MLTKKELAVVLRKNGYKVTPQRLAVYEILSEKRWHPTAEMIYERLKQNYPAMSFATVYKTVDILKKINVIQVLSTGDDSFLYDADISEHYHLQCDVCGTIYDIDMPQEIYDLTKAVEEESGFRIQRRQFYCYGVCASCSKAD